MRYTYPTYKVLSQDPSVLAASENLFDAVILTTYWAIKRKRNELKEEELLDLKLDLMRRLLDKNVDKTRIRKLLRFIKAYIRFEKPEINRIFEEKYEELLKIDKPMGVDEILNKQAKEEGIAIGMEKGMEKARTEAELKHHNMLKSVIFNMRKEGFSVAKIANLMTVSENQVEAFFRELDSEK
jgi:predicted transposase YdaD